MKENEHLPNRGPVPCTLDARVQELSSYYFYRPWHESICANMQSCMLTGQCHLLRRIPSSVDAQGGVEIQMQWLRNPGQEFNFHYKQPPDP